LLVREHLLGGSQVLVWPIEAAFDFDGPLQIIDGFFGPAKLDQNRSIGLARESPLQGIRFPIRSISHLHD
jgi:hypothetical protein